MRSNAKCLIAVLTAVCAWGLAAAPVGAQSPDDEARAREHFFKGRDLVDKGELGAACEEFAASLRLSPRSSSALNLAECREKQGKLASARASYRELVELARAEGETERAIHGRQRVKALDSRVPRLRIDFKLGSGDGAVADLELRLDDAVVPPARIGDAIEVDPGEHEITATATGVEPFSRRIALKEGQQEKVVIELVPVVRDSPATEPETTEPETTGPADAAAGTESTPDLSSDPMNDDAPTSTRGRSLRVAGLASTGVGLLAIVGGVKYHLDARSLSDEFSNVTWSPELEQRFQDAEGEDAERNARLLYGIGAAAVVTGGVLYYIGLRVGKNRPLEVAITPGVQGVGQVVVTGRF